MTRMRFSNFAHQLPCAHHVPHRGVEAVPAPLRVNTGLHDATDNDALDWLKFAFATSVTRETPTSLGRQP